VRHIARATDHVLLSTLSANAAAVARGEVIALPVVDPAIGATFAILRLESRTLPPIADALARAIDGADRAALGIERDLAANPPARAVKSPSGRRARAVAPAPAAR
jgi:hypothetical protein